MTTYIQLNNELNIPVDGSIPLKKDKEAVEAYFAEHVKGNTWLFHDLEEKIDYLITNNYIEKEVIENYSFDFVKELFKSIYAHEFRFNSFMGAYKFYTQYALSTFDKSRYLERYEDRIAMNALLMGDGNEETAMAIAHEMITTVFQPATPTFLNAGKSNRGELVSCFLLDIPDDLNAIGRAINSSLKLSSMGGGVGLNLSNLRKLGDPIKNIKNASGGIVPVMKLAEYVFSYANQLGQRQGAGAVYLNTFHGDILDFLSTRKENAEASKQVKMLSLGITVPDKFYELVENDENIHIFSPYDVSKVYNKPFSYIDISKEYDNMVANPKISSTVLRARDLDTEISKLQQESGYPYVLNVDTANRANPVYGNIIMSNLCSEILQVQEPSEINDRQEYTSLGTDISCNLGSINLPNLLEVSTSFEKSIETAVRALTYVTKESNIEAVPTVQHGNNKSHAIGLGAMGLHTLFATNKMHYGSKDSIEVTDILFMMLNYYSIKASNKIAIEEGETFEGFEKSKYATGEYFADYVEKDYTPSNEAVSKVFSRHEVPTKADWRALAESVAEYGLFHKNRMAVAPTGSISYIHETSSSIHPITSLVERREEGKLGAIYYPAPRLSNETLPYYKTAYDTSMLDVIDIYATAQKHVDQGMSLTLFFHSMIPAGLYPWKPEGGKMTTRDVSLVRHYAWKKGIKSIYYVRTFTEDDKEVGTAHCESCII